MNSFQISVATIMLGLSLSTVGSSQSIKGSGLTSTSAGTITGSKVGTITGSKTGNIGGMRTEKLCGSQVSGIDDDNYFPKLLILMLKLRGGF